MVPFEGQFVIRPGNQPGDEDLVATAKNARAFVGPEPAPADPNLIRLVTVSAANPDVVMGVLEFVGCPSKVRLLPAKRVSTLMVSASLPPGLGEVVAARMVEALMQGFAQQAEFGYVCATAAAGNEETNMLLAKGLGWSVLQPPRDSPVVKYVWFVPKERRKRAKKSRG